jgi:hypothetical protein
MFSSRRARIGDLWRASGRGLRGRRHDQLASLLEREPQFLLIEGRETFSYFIDRASRGKILEQDFGLHARSPKGWSPAQNALLPDNDRTGLGFAHDGTSRLDGHGSGNIAGPRPP